MGELIVQLIPPAFGIILSPLAIMALIAIMVSKNARVNGVAFLLGWVIGVVGVVAIGLWLFAALEVHVPRDPPVWVSWLRLLLGLVLVASAVWVYRRSRSHTRAMAAATTPQEVAEAAPQLPGWLQTVSTFRPGRSGALGLGLFVLNPVDFTCAIIASLDITMAGLAPAPTTVVALLFCAVSVVTVFVPVIFVLVRGKAAQPALDWLRDWVAQHSPVLNAALLLVIGVLQIQKGVGGLV